MGDCKSRVLPDLGEASLLPEGRFKERLEFLVLHVDEMDPLGEPLEEVLGVGARMLLVVRPIKPH